MLLSAILLFFAACASKPKYITDSSDYTSFGVDYHDIEKMVARNAKSLLNSDFVKNLEGKKILVISDIENLTNDDIDMELLSRKFVRQIRNSKKFILTNAIAGSGSKRDKMIKEARKLRNDKEYNQYTTIEDGNLHSPDYSLAGKIIQRTKSIGKNERVDYQFLLVLSDIKTGVVLWDNEEIISKVIAKDKLQEYIGEDSSSAYNQSYYTPSNTYTKSYSPQKEKTKGFFSNFGTAGRNHIVFGADIGGSNITFWRVGNMQSQNFNVGFPLTLRIGYERDIGEKWALGANFVYIFNFAAILSDYHYESEYTKDDTPILKDYNSRRLGFEVVGSYKTELLGYSSTIYAGFGLSKDSGSYATVSTQYEYIYSPTYYYSTTRYAYKNNTYELSSLYPLLKLGVMWYVKPAVGISWELNYGWSIDKQNYINTGVGLLVFGILFRI